MAAAISDHGEGSSRVNASEGTLDDVMRAPSKAPDVVVLDRIPDGLDTTEVLDPKEDLWLTTADGSVTPSTVLFACVVDLPLGRPSTPRIYFILYVKLTSFQSI